MKLHFEKGAILPRASGQTSSRISLLHIRLADLYKYYGTTTTLQIMFVCQKKHIGKTILRDAGFTEHEMKNIIISTPESIKDDIQGKELFDIIIDLWMLSVQNSNGLTLEFK